MVGEVDDERDCVDEDVGVARVGATRAGGGVGATGEGEGVLGVGTAVSVFPDGGTGSVEVLLSPEEAVGRLVVLGTVGTTLDGVSCEAPETCIVF